MIMSDLRNLCDVVGQERKKTNFRQKEKKILVDK